MIAENFPRMKKETGIQVWESQGVPSKMKSKKAHTKTCYN